MTFRARLDDLRLKQRRSVVFANLVGEIVATRVDDVVPAIEAVQRAGADGLWAVGFIGYEAAPAFDPHLVVRARAEGGFHGDLPLLWFGLFDGRVVNPVGDNAFGGYEISPWRWVDERAVFEHAVETIRDHIAAGETYQVNYTTRLRARFSGDPVAFYHDLTAAQSGGYGTYLDAGRFKIVSASPELFFDRHPTLSPLDRLVTRPMKGTSPRGRWRAEDLANYRELARSEKDRAENLIIVDLLRNDLGRVAEFGSVVADELFSIERFDTVWQMTSTITGSIDEATPLVVVLRALFPCGSITGAPKVRTMEIIRDVETEPRGVYTGAIGFVAPPGVPGPRASFSVGIRTVVIDGATGDAEYGVGGGITYDSDPRSEYEEAALKARILSYGRCDFELLETMRWGPVSGWYWRDLHLERLRESAEYFGIPLDVGVVVERLDEAVRGSGESRVRMTVSRGGRVRVNVEPFVKSESSVVAVAIDLDPVDTSSPFLFHKTTRRAVYDERRARHPYADDVLLVNGHGELTESTIANIAVRFGETWFTPPVEAGCLAGIYRRVLLDEGRLVERPIAVTDLDECEEIALLNSVRLWRRAVVVPEG
ncbi:MAG: aminodeoxychorismate synthase component I [Actinomycetota bacterium]|nr:aminodeoxychorismate synthase component I [Actinomycetota bacterium]